MKTVAFIIFVLALGYIGILISAHTKDHFVIGRDYYWHGKKFVTQPESCSASEFNTQMGEVKFFGCGEDGNETVVVKSQ